MATLHEAIEELQATSVALLLRVDRLESDIDTNRHAARTAENNLRVRLGELETKVVDDTISPQPEALPKTLMGHEIPSDRLHAIATTFEQIAKEDSGPYLAPISWELAAKFLHLIARGAE